MKRWINVSYAASLLVAFSIPTVLLVLVLGWPPYKQLMPETEAIVGHISSIESARIGHRKRENILIRLDGQAHLFRRSSEVWRVERIKQDAPVTLVVPKSQLQEANRGEIGFVTILSLYQNGVEIFTLANALADIYIIFGVAIILYVLVIVAVSQGFRNGRRRKRLLVD